MNKEMTEQEKPDYYAENPEIAKVLSGKKLRFSILECVESGDGFEKGCLYASVGTNNGIQVIRENEYLDAETHIYQSSGFPAEAWDASGKPSFRLVKAERGAIAAEMEEEEKDMSEEITLYELIGRVVMEMEKERMAKKREYVRANIDAFMEDARRKNGQQETASKEEQEERAADLRTQGRKGCKAARINMAFTTDNYEFLKRESKRNGETITQFANRMIQDAKFYYFAKKRGIAK